MMSSAAKENWQRLAVFVKEYFIPKNSFSVKFLHWGIFERSVLVSDAKSTLT